MGHCYVDFAFVFTLNVVYLLQPHEGDSIHQIKEEFEAWSKAVIALVEEQPAVFGPAVSSLLQRWPKLTHSQKASWLSTRPADICRRK